MTNQLQNLKFIPQGHQFESFRDAKLERQRTNTILLAKLKRWRFAYKSQLSMVERQSINILSRAKLVRKMKGYNSTKNPGFVVLTAKGKLEALALTSPICVADFCQN